MAQKSGPCEDVAGTSTATVTLSQYLNKHQMDITVIQESWLQGGRMARLAETKGKVIYDFTK